MTNSNDKDPSYYTSTHVNTFIPLTIESLDLKLAVGKYTVYLGGGSDVSLNGFQLELTNLKNHKNLFMKEVKWPFTSAKSGRILVPLFEFSVEQFSTFRLRFHNVENLHVRPSKLLISRLFQSPKSIHHLSIYIEKK